MKAQQVHIQIREQGIDRRFFDRRLMELRDLGLTYGAISKVVRFYEGWTLTEDQIRAWLVRRGASKDQRKVDAAREQAKRARVLA